MLSTAAATGTADEHGQVSAGLPAGGQVSATIGDHQASPPATSTSIGRAAAGSSWPRP